MNFKINNFPGLSYSGICFKFKITWTVKFGSFIVAVEGKLIGKKLDIRISFWTKYPKGTLLSPIKDFFRSPNT